jgi:hypothetical protein
LLSILKELGVAGAIVRIQMADEFWTNIYFEATLARMPAVRDGVFSTLRNSSKFTQCGNPETRSVFTKFGTQPSLHNRIHGVAIYESLVSKDFMRSNSSGKQFMFVDDKTAVERTLSKASSFINTMHSVGSSIVKISKASVGTKSVKDLLYKEITVKFDGDRASRRKSIYKFDEFEESVRKIILAVEAEGGMEEYVLLCEEGNRLVESVEDIFSLKDAAVVVVVKRSNAFAARV